MIINIFSQFILSEYPHTTRKNRATKHKSYLQNNFNEYHFIHFLNRMTNTTKYAISVEKEAAYKPMKRIPIMLIKTLIIAPIKVVIITVFDSNFAPNIPPSKEEHDEKNIANNRINIHEYAAAEPKPDIVK